MPIYRVPVTITYPLPGGPGVNVWSLRAGADLLPDVQTLENAMAALRAFYVGVALYSPNSLVYSFPTEVTTQDGQDFTVLPTTTPVSGGGVNSSYMPPATAICVSWRTQSPTRSGRGRTFVGPLSTAQIQADGTPIPTTLAGVRDAAQALADAGAEDGSTNDAWAFGVWSRTQGLHRDFRSATVTDQFAVLRSRRD